MCGSAFFFGKHGANAGNPAAFRIIFPPREKIGGKLKESEEYRYESNWDRAAHR